MHQIYLQTLSQYISSDHAMKTMDGRGFKKKGKGSVAVKRQYCASLGRAENCQVEILLGYTSSKGYGLLETQLYLPEEWRTEEYTERRRRCEVPEDLGFLSRP